MADANEHLRDAAVLVVGVGGLGCPAALALVNAGVGRLGLVDFDRVDPSNLPRQILYRDEDVGDEKVVVAARHLRASRADLRIDEYPFKLGDDAAGLFERYDAVVDGTDSAALKFSINDAAVAARRPLAHAGVTGDRGQLLAVLPGRTACLRCLFAEEPTADDAPACSEAGVLGPLVGVFGALQAGVAAAAACGEPVPFAGRLVLAANGRWRSLVVERDPECTACAGLGER